MTLCEKCPYTEYFLVRIWTLFTHCENQRISKLESCSQYFQTSWWLSKFSFHHKWNEAWLLVIKLYIRVASGAAKRIKTYDPRKLGNIRKISKLHRNIAQGPVLPPRNQNFASTSKNLLKNRNRTFPAVLYFTWKPETAYNTLWMIAGECIRLDQDILKTSWRFPLKTKTKDVFKSSSRRLHQDRCLLG